MEPWEHVVEIPEGAVGTYRIEHFTKPAGEPIERSSLRTAMFGGQADEPLVFDHETRWHRLVYEGGTWMTDLPIEQTQHDLELRDVEGRVLIGGLGLGYAVNVLAARDEVDEIVVVEISPEVCALVGPHVKDPEGKVTIVNADLFDYLSANGDYFDCAFYDIWQSDGEGTFFQTVWPLRKLSEGWIDDGRIVCWNENVMRGQLVSSLLSRWHMTQVAQIERGFATQAKFPEVDDMACARPVVEPDAFWWNWSVPFWRAVKAGVVTEENFMRAAGAYAGTFGHEGFEVWWALVLAGAVDL